MNRKWVKGLPPSQWAFQKLLALGQIRDGILISGAIIYGVGYLFWSVHALQHNLGFLPALDLQYLIAGILPSFILILSLVLGRLLYRFVMDIWPGLVGPDATGFWLGVRMLLIAALYCIIFSLLISASFGAGIVLLLLILLPFILNKLPVKPYDELSGAKKTGRIILLALFIGCIGGMYYFSDYLEGLLPEFLKNLKDQRWWVIPLYLTILLCPPLKGWELVSRFKVIYFIITVLFLPVFGFIYYIQHIYPSLPQEFGGVSARCATLDMDSKNLSAELRASLIRTSISHDSSPVVLHTVPLKVYYANQQILLVKIKHPSRGQDATKVFEINKKDVNTISWCNPD